MARGITTDQTSLSGSTLYAHLDKFGQWWNGAGFEGPVAAEAACSALNAVRYRSASDWAPAGGGVASPTAGAWGLRNACLIALEYVSMAWHEPHEEAPAALRAGTAAAT